MPKVTPMFDAVFQSRIAEIQARYAVERLKAPPVPSMSSAEAETKKILRRLTSAAPVIRDQLPTQIFRASRNVIG
jgi:hypothetical protein